MKICSIPTCGEPVNSRGWCSKHYTRWKRTGDPEGLTRPYRDPPHVVRGRDERFWEKVDQADECWPWTGSCNSAGYGQLRTGNRLEKAHRISWEISAGPIPDGLDVLHRCDNPPCVRPSHLWIGTPKDNAADRQSKGRQNRRPGDLRRTIPTKANGRWRGNPWGRSGRPGR